MRLAKNALIFALIVLTFALTMSAQTLRQLEDPRNIAPTVGTGGSMGGPTGLFTIYDGQTLRRGEYTFSLAYSNFDRDPGNVDITEIPISFQIGLSDNLELFFNTDAYRGIKVNSPQVLSSFYLPNSQLRTGSGLLVPAAIVLAPQGPTTTAFTNTAVFRPVGAPFVQFPFTGGNGGNFGVQFPFLAAPLFGFAGTFPTLGPPSGGGAAANFPGVGSAYGSILPGVVLSTQNITGANGQIVGTAPLVYSVAPSYLPDAPFINRIYGQSAFSTFTAGAKWRITSVENPFGLAVVGFYRWYADKASDQSGFNQLQRGASPGGNKGDIGVYVVADSRLRKWLNVSANVGYIYNSSVKGEFPNGSFTLLDRPDELQFGAGLDFPTNKYFQPILEFRGTRYVAGRTPNAFENNPIDGIAGLRIFPKRWFGFGFAYRYNFNQFDNDAIEDTTFSQNVFVFNRTSATNAAGLPVGNLAVAGGGTITSAGPLTNAFPTSTDPHGFIFQTWIGRRNARGGQKVLDQPANVEDIALDSVTVVLPCAPGTQSKSGGCKDDQVIGVRTNARDPENATLTYNYTVSGGRIVGQGANVNWDLSGVRTGTYTITAAVDDGCGFCGKTVTKTVTVSQCTDCETPCSCPTLSISGPTDLVPSGGTATFTASVSGGTQDGVTYNWSVSNGTIVSGQGTSAITVTAPDSASVTATFEIGGLCPNCDRSRSATANWAVKDVPPPINPQKIDEFGALQNDDLKQRLDNYFIRLNNEPSAGGTIINYGTAKQKAARMKAIDAAIKFRNFDRSRLTFVDGGDGGGEVKTELWLVPPGANQPTPSE